MSEGYSFLCSFERGCDELCRVMMLRGDEVEVDVVKLITRMHLSSGRQIGFRTEANVPPVACYLSRLTPPPRRLSSSFKIMIWQFAVVRTHCAQSTASDHPRISSLPDLCSTTCTR